MSDGFRQTDHMMLTVSGVTSTLSCAMMCIGEVHCRGFNWISTDSECQMLSLIQDPYTEGGTVDVYSQLYLIEY